AQCRLLDYVPILDFRSSFMPHFSEVPCPTRYNSLRLLGHDYASPSNLYFVTMVTGQSRPLFGDLRLAKTILRILLGAEAKLKVRIHAFTLLPDHFHFLISMGDSGIALPSFLGRFKSLTTREYWKRSRQIVMMGRQIELPPKKVVRSDPRESRQILQAVMDWRAVIRPEAIGLKTWPNVTPDMFLNKQLWQDSMYDHVIRNDADLRETLEYIARNPVKRGYVKVPHFYPLIGFAWD